MENKVRGIINSLDIIFGSILGVTLIDLGTDLILGVDSLFHNVETWAKIFASFAGTVYFIIMARVRHAAGKLDNDIKKQELEKLKRENLKNK